MHRKLNVPGKSLENVRPIFGSRFNKQSDIHKYQYPDVNKLIHDTVKETIQQLIDEGMLKRNN